jgi:glycosyltransferase involved in cell wall biosynthesis
LIPDGTIAVKCKKRYNKPLVVTLHGEDITKYSKMLFLKSLSKFILKRCDKIICVSKSLKNEIYKTNLSKKDIEIIPSGYNIERFRPLDTKKCRKILDLPENKTIILFVGHLIERKGIMYLIKALKILSEKNKEFLCYIVGRGVLEKSLKLMTSQLQLKNKVIFAGQKNPDEIPIWMNACDVLVLPSLNEGLPNVLSEAMACGKPVVATNVAGTPELVTKDVGLLVKPKNVNDLAKKITLALNKKWDKGKLLKRAREFSVTNSVKKLIDIYRSLLI